MMQNITDPPPHENFDRGLPLALIALESQGMMKDCVYGITQTVYHAPYYTRHVVSPTRITLQAGEAVKAEANYKVFRTKPVNVSEVYNVGRHIDKITKKATPGSSGVASACTTAR